MGLDITTYRGLTPADAGDAFDARGELKWEEPFTQLYLNPDFPGRADEFEDRRAYRYEESEGFYAGSYGGYNAWRNHLAQLVGHAGADAVWRDPQPGPFVELINFSDCEGVLGTAVCAKLARDFAAWQEKADAYPDAYFREKYREWRRAFEMAADRGCVRFH